MDKLALIGLVETTIKSINLPFNANPPDKHDYWDKLRDALGDALVPIIEDWEDVAEKRGFGKEHRIS